MNDVTIVGAGIVGLSCALRLLEAGARVSIRCTDAPENTVSATAAAVWYPSGFPAGDARSLIWARGGFDQLAEHAGQGAPGAIMRHTRMLLRGPKPAPWWGPAVPDFRIVEHDGTQAGVVQEWQFTVPTVEMRPYLSWLVQRVKDAGGELDRRPVQALRDLETPVVVNATGLGARTLAQDEGVHPIRGQIVLVSNPGIETSVRDEQNPAGSTYVHPRRNDIVLGGTVEPGQDDVLPDPAVNDAILERCRALVPELAEARELGRAVGLRPGRAGGIRLEVVPGARPGTHVVHNYGHGGAGVTLAWGCADETTRLIQGL
ncbi:FAD-dependent oxidoreductase [Kineosporia babensis]|uniref:D-amino-acid oxidase n=1 Tax=Kineosporia babensis TaxID=499548 RepID=A0A9X1NC01_9ACTN|nr:FAD-dependent oxidoreductase [Kineosporia babensis]MCD5310981.1 FAD-binding oxidoreductase [Kineosporia babensis]